MTLALSGAGVIATAVSVFWGPIGPLPPPGPGQWARLATAPFVHGFSTWSVVPHLIGNLLLLLYAGSQVERALGSARFAALTAAALLAYSAIQLLCRYEVNGASVFIWAYGPPLAVLHFPVLGGTATTPRPTYAVLAVMWVLVPLGMTTIPYSLGWSGSVVGAFLVANAFHLSATVTGVIGAFAWRKRLREQTLSEEVLCPI